MNNCLAVSCRNISVLELSNFTTAKAIIEMTSYMIFIDSFRAQRCLCKGLVPVVPDVDVDVVVVVVVVVVAVVVGGVISTDDDERDCSWWWWKTSSFPTPT